MRRTSSTSATGAETADAGEALPGTEPAGGSSSLHVHPLQPCDGLVNSEGLSPSDLEGLFAGVDAPAHGFVIALRSRGKVTGEQASSASSDECVTGADGDA